MKRLSLWLVVRADGTTRTRTRRPRSQELHLDEIAIPLRIDFPDGWGEIRTDTVVIDVPGPPEVAVMPAPAVRGTEP